MSFLEILQDAQYSRLAPVSGYAVLRGEKAPDDALARELGAMGLL